MKILVTGANGRLGSAMIQRLGAHTIIPIVGDDSDSGVFVEITNYQEVRHFMQVTQPDLVIHTAAWTDVDGCARDPHKALRVNGVGAHYVAVAAAQVGAAILHISTNEVFDGNASTPYHEYATHNPVNAYARSKAYAEQAVIRVNPRHYIVRTAWLFAHGGRNFVQSIRNEAQAGRPLRVVCDEISNPTYTDDLADALVALMRTECYGTYHLVNEGAASRYAFARAILDQAGYTATPIEKISMAQWQRPSTPPAYAPLANVAAAQLGIQLRPWQAALTAFLDKEALAHV